MPGEADGIQGDDPGRDEDLEFQAGMGEDPGIATTPPPPD